MNNKKHKTKNNSKPPNSLKDLEFYCNYNKSVSKNKFKNSLTKSEISYYDNLLETSIPEKAQIAQEAYSIESDLFNDYYKLSKSEYGEKIKEDDSNVKELGQLMRDLKKSEIKLKKDIIVHRGFDVGPIDSKKLKETKNYISTSVDKAIACGYTRGTGEVISIEVPKGTKIMYLRKYSIYPRHMEVLIPPKYHIHEYKEENIIKYKVRKRKKQYLNNILNIIILKKNTIKELLTWLIEKKKLNLGN